MRPEIAIRAAQDMRELHLYGIEKYGAAAADAYLDEMFKKVEYIAQWPFSARERLNVRPPIRLNRYRAHNMLYAVTGETVIVLRIFHHSVNWIDLF